MLLLLLDNGHDRRTIPRIHVREELIEACFYSSKCSLWHGSSNFKSSADLSAVCGIVDSEHVIGKALVRPAILVVGSAFDCVKTLLFAQCWRFLCFFFQTSVYF